MVQEEEAMHAHNKAPANMKYDLGSYVVEGQVDPWAAQDIDFFFISSSEETTEGQWDQEIRIEQPVTAIELFSENDWP